MFTEISFKLEGRTYLFKGSIFTGSGVIIRKGSRVARDIGGVSSMATACAGGAGGWTGTELLLGGLLFTIILSFLITKLVSPFNLLRLSSSLSILKDSLSCLVLSTEIKILLYSLQW